MSGDIQGALEKIEASVAVQPGNALTWAEAGVIHYEAGHLDEAIASCRRYLEAEENNAGVLSNLGVALVEQGSIHDALRCFERAIELEPGNPDHHYNSSMAYLYLEEGYSTGFEKYRFRRQGIHRPILPDSQPNCQEWQGEPLGEDEALLVVSEQGFGDTLQFMRYVSHLRSRLGVDVHLCTTQKLHGLIKESGIDDCPLTLEQGREFSAGK
jgi:tetratricopeptide (TPR) repeat protein